jgi:hypothetical protein
VSAEDNEKKIMAGTAAVNNRDIEGFTRLLEPGFKLYFGSSYALTAGVALHARR